MVASSPSATCSPTSLHLRLVMSRCNCRWGGNWKPHFTIPTRLVRPVSMDRRSMAASSSGPDGFAGWSDSGEGGSSSEDEEKKWLGGAVAAGVAWMVLFAGVAFAAMSLSKRSTTRRPEPVMESLTARQEVLLAADGEECTGEGGRVEVRPAPTESGELPDTEDSGGGNDLSEVESVEQSANHGYTGNDDAHTREIDAQDISPLSVESYASDIITQSSSANSEIPIGILDNHENEQHSITDEPRDILEEAELETEGKANLSSDPSVPQSNEPLPVSKSVGSPSETVLETAILLEEDDKSLSSFQDEEVFDLAKIPNSLPLEVSDIESSRVPESTTNILFDKDLDILANSEAKGDRSHNGPASQESIFSSSGIPAPSVVPPALQVPPGKVLVPAVLDQFQGQAFTALQTLKVIEADVQPSDICTRREYARWLVAASGALSRNIQSKVYPAMYIENISKLAFDDVMANDPDFPSIQGLAEAGLISSKLSSNDLLSSSDENRGCFLFAPESPLSRQNLVSWKMALERRQLPEADKNILYQLSGFRDVDGIHPDAWPALIADLSVGDQGIIPLAFGCTRLFQPDKPITKAQAAVALATGESADVVSEELTRIEAESMAGNVVSIHNDLVAQVEKEINARFEKALSSEREKAGTVEKMAEEALHELEKLRSERDESSITLMKERAAIDAEMEVLSRLRSEVEEQLASLLSNKAVISHEKERIDKMQKEAVFEKQDISRLQYELEVERKALSMARAWAEDEAKKAREHLKAIEEARERWERRGIKVIVDADLRQESTAALACAEKQVSTNGAVNRAENLVGKLKLMADQVRGKSKEVYTYHHSENPLPYHLVERMGLKVREGSRVYQDKATMNTDGSLQDIRVAVSGGNSALQDLVRDSVEDLQQSTQDLIFAVRGGTKHLVVDCRDGMGWDG